MSDVMPSKATAHPPGRRALVAESQAVGVNADGGLDLWIRGSFSLRP